jgi:hypothetical protein
VKDPLIREAPIRDRSGNTNTNPNSSVATSVSVSLLSCHLPPKVHHLLPLLYMLIGDPLAPAGRGHGGSLLAYKSTFMRAKSSKSSEYMHCI